MRRRKKNGPREGTVQSTVVVTILASYGETFGSVREHTPSGPTDNADIRSRILPCRRPEHSRSDSYLSPPFPGLRPALFSGRSLPGFSSAGDESIARTMTPQGFKSQTRLTAFLMFPLFPTARGCRVVGSSQLGFSCADFASTRQHVAKEFA